VTEYIGSTLRATFVNSGATVSPLSSALRDSEDVLVSSVTATSSGNGFYYAEHAMPMSACWLVNEWIGVINANTYRRYQLVEVQKPEVD
jgi:hypothetical protein